VRILSAVLVPFVALVLAVPVCEGGSTDKVAVRMTGLKIVDDKDKGDKRGKPDKRIADVYPWLKKRFPGKKFIVLSDQKGKLKEKDKLSMPAPGGKKLILTVEKITRASFTYRFEAEWKDEKGKKRKWAGFRRTVRRGNKVDLTVTNVPGVKLDEGVYAVLIKSAMPKAKKD